MLRWCIRLTPSKLYGTYGSYPCRVAPFISAASKSWLPRLLSVLASTLRRMPAPKSWRIGRGDWQPFGKRSLSALPQTAFLSWILLRALCWRKMSRKSRKRRNTGCWPAPGEAIPTGPTDQGPGEVFVPLGRCVGLQWPWTHLTPAPRN